MLSSRNKATSEPSQAPESRPLLVGDVSTRLKPEKADAKAAKGEANKEKEHAKARRPKSAGGLDDGTRPQWTTQDSAPIDLDRE